MLLNDTLYPSTTLCHLHYTTKPKYTRLTFAAWAKQQVVACECGSGSRTHPTEQLISFSASQSRSMKANISIVVVPMYSISACRLFCQSIQLKVARVTQDTPLRWYSQSVATPANPIQLDYDYLECTTQLLSICLLAHSHRCVTVSMNELG